MIGRRIVHFKSLHYAAMFTLVLAAVLGLLAWHFSWRQAAFLSTGEKIGQEEAQRAGILADRLGYLAIAAVVGATLLAWTKRKREPIQLTEPKRGKWP